MSKLAVSNAHIKGKSKVSRLWFAIRLPNLPAQALDLDSNDERALIITEKRAVVWGSPAAIAAGVILGMDATTAQLLAGSGSYERNIEAEDHLLHSISADMYSFTPYIDVYRSPYLAQAGVLLEVSQCLNLFGGAKALANKLIAFFEGKNRVAALGFAHTLMGAWLLSFAHYRLQGGEDKPLFVRRLKQLPIQLLHDFPKQVDALERTGFILLNDIVKQVEAESISSIKKRFGQGFSKLLCDVFEFDLDLQQNSLFEQPLSAYQPEVFFSETLQFEYPIHQVEQLQEPLEHLLNTLANFLRERQLQTQHIEWALADIYSNKEALHVYSDQSQSNFQLLYDLTLIQLENRETRFEVDTLILHCRHMQGLQATTERLDFDGQSTRAGQDFAITAAKIKARLGSASVYKLSYKDSYIAEQSNQYISIDQPCQQQLPICHRVSLRPTWLLESPIKIDQRQQGLYWRGYLTLLVGPERLQGNWWDVPCARDYFLAQRSDCVRLWVFWDLHKQYWYVQGIFG